MRDRIETALFGWGLYWPVVVGAFVLCVLIGGAVAGTIGVLVGELVDLAVLIAVLRAVYR